MAEKALLTVTEYCDYLGIGKTKGRQLLRSPQCPYAVKIGNRWYANRKKLDKWLENQS